MAATAAAMEERDSDYRSLRQKYYKPVPVENSLYVEALDKFKKYQIPKSFKRDPAFWLDNDRIAFSSREYPGWKAKPEELSRIISYNFLSGEIVDSGYRGRLQCLNHLGEILVAQPEKGSGDALQLKDFHWHAGKWGQPLRRIDYLVNSVIIRHRCMFYPYGDPIYRDPPEILGPDAARVTPLMPQHGAIKETVVRVDGKLQDKVFLIKPNGESVQISNRRPNHFRFTYQPWNESYFEVNTAPVEPRTYFPSGEVVSHTIPELFLDWKKTRFSSVAAFPSRAGILWDIQLPGSSWRMQGIYLQAGKTLLRIEDGYPMSFHKSSPNGCRIHSSGVRGDVYSDHSKPFDIVIDLCTENKK